MGTDFWDTVSQDGVAQADKLDAMIIGVGVAGLYQLHQLRKQGLKVRAYDSASNVGGTSTVTTLSAPPA